MCGKSDDKLLVNSVTRQPMDLICFLSQHHLLSICIHLPSSVEIASQRKYSATIGFFLTPINSAVTQTYGPLATKQQIERKQHNHTWRVEKSHQSVLVAHLAHLALMLKQSSMQATLAGKMLANKILNLLGLRFLDLKSQAMLHLHLASLEILAILLPEALESEMMFPLPAGLQFPLLVLREMVQGIQLRLVPADKAQSILLVMSLHPLRAAGLRTSQHKVVAFPGSQIHLLHATDSITSLDRSLPQYIQELPTEPAEPTLPNSTSSPSYTISHTTWIIMMKKHPDSSFSTAITSWA